MSTEEAEEVCTMIPEILFQIETSAKDNTNVENAFAKIAEELMVSQSILYQTIRQEENFILEPPKQRWRRNNRRNQTRTKQISRERKLQLLILNPVLIIIT